MRVGISQAAETDVLALQLVFRHSKCQRLAYAAQQYGVIALALAGKYIAYKLSQPGLKHS
jgi:hypothetical protein